MPPKKKPASKDWYWEAEQDKIAADPDLKLIRSPEGGPHDSEGLDCVGLWTLVMNLMAMSSRKGYLSDPADRDKPMRFTDLALLVSRSECLVSRLMEVILKREMFSKNEQGIIYSRGMVRKEELRKIRSKSGRKGGLRSQVLLKQNFKQNTEQTLGIGIGIETPSSSNGVDFAQAKFDDAAHRLAFLYRSCLKGRRPEEETIVVQAFTEMLAMGATEDEITRDLKRGPPARNRAEYLWQINNRLLEQNTGKVGKLEQAAIDAREWANGEKINEQG